MIARTQPMGRFWGSASTGAQSARRAQVEAPAARASALLSNSLRSFSPR